MRMVTLSAKVLVSMHTGDYQYRITHRFDPHLALIINFVPLGYFFA